ncbi:MAG: hypothetical protein KDA54_15020 [Phycisphaerales bacterium]|nr:hypothetical protein [Phycisphaerales bacterium]
MQLSHEAYREVKCALERYKTAIEKTNLRASTKKTYIHHADTFVRWLTGDFEPGKAKAKRI